MTDDEISDAVRLAVVDFMRDWQAKVPPEYCAFRMFSRLKVILRRIEKPMEERHG